VFFKSAGVPCSIKKKVKKTGALFIVLFVATNLFAQNKFTVVIKDSTSGETISDATAIVLTAGKGATTDINGVITIRNIPDGKFSVQFSSIGYKTQTLSYIFPLKDSVTAILMEKSTEELEKVIVSSSRTDSRIENLPTKVEVLGTEEVDEESGVKPSHVASLLGDVAGIQTQQTSAVTGNTDLRVQGLQGKYTQLLRDGMPLFGGYAGSFSILQIPPLDLKQIEIIKGAASTLYGGGAIAGMINLISKKPKEGRFEKTITLNQSTLKESNINLYLSNRNKKTGFTFFTGGNYQKAVDVNKDGFSDVGDLKSFFIHPVIFFYPNEKNTLSVGLNSNYEDRNGGDMQVLKDKKDNTHQFFISNKSFRNSADFDWENKISKTKKLTVKGIASWFNRDISTNTFGMKANQLSYYTEVSYLKKSAKHDLVAGININGENFNKKLPDSTSIQNYNYTTLGLFVQDDWRIHPKFIAESGLRSDFHNKYGTFILPRLSLLYKINHEFTSRLGGGLGYKIPTVFDSEIDERDYPLLQPLQNVKAERSAGANWDVNFKKNFNAFGLTINQSFYITQINDPLVAVTNAGKITYANAGKPITTRGFETYIQFTFDKLEAYLGYTRAVAKKLYDPAQPFLELSARDKFASVIAYTFSDRFRACIEAAYTGKQYLETGKQSEPFLFAAAMVRYDIKNISIVLNCEDLFDYRQTRKESIFSGSLQNPVFKQLWAPIDGRVINLSMKINL
jgi:outer membrane receptor for ferrienterochelin and colicins